MKSTKKKKSNQMWYPQPLVFRQHHKQLYFQLKFNSKTSSMKILYTLYIHTLNIALYRGDNEYGMGMGEVRDI